MSIAGLLYVQSAAHKLKVAKMFAHHDAENPSLKLNLLLILFKLKHLSKIEWLVWYIFY